MADHLAQNDLHAIALARQAVKNLNARKVPPITTIDPVAPKYPAEELYGVIPTDTRKPFDVREIIARIVDGSEFDEFKARYGATLVTGFAHIEGMPVGIVATAFAQEIHRREFVVTWSMIASVPLFGQLDAVEIAEVMQFLRARTVKAGAVVAHAGDPLQALYFVASGEVEIAVASGKARLDEGHFFGALTLDDVAIASHSPCVTAATATEPTKLLVLDQIDFRALTARSPKLAAHIRAKAHR